MSALDGSVLAAATWVVTYLVHSTLALGGAALALQGCHAGARVREVAWKCALCLPFVTATAHAVWPERAFAPRYTVTVQTLGSGSGPASVVALDAERSELEQAGAAAAGASAARARAGSPLAALRLDERAAPTHRPAWTDALATRVRAVPREVWQSLAVLAATLATCSLLLVPRLRLVWLLRRRERLDSGVLAEELAELAPRAGLTRVRLSVCDALRSPIALGTLRPEIVVPRRALTALSRPLARALVAHELAHHARRDPLWMSLAHTACTLFALQPLNRLARRELVAAAELLADDLALEWTEDGVGLARCLTEVAGWSLAGERGLPALSMVRARDVSGLRRRVECALARPREKSARHLALGALALGGVVALAAPGLALVARTAVAPRPRFAPLLSAPTHAAAAAPLAALEGELASIRADLGRIRAFGDPTSRTATEALAARAEALTDAVAALRAELGRPTHRSTSVLADAHD